MVDMEIEDGDEGDGKLSKLISHVNYEPTTSMEVGDAQSRRAQ